MTKYASWLAELKGKIRSAQLKAAVSVNRELLALYWEIGQSLSQKVEQANWGSAVVEELSKDLKTEFPNQQGFSRSNLFSMKKWFEFYAQSGLELEKVQQAVGQIPWGHNVLIISKSETVEEALFYCQKTIENNWSRTVLTHQISGQLYNRQSKAINNFNDTLPEPHSELAIETLKDPYKLDFLDLGEKLVERDLENQLVEHITSFLLELGAGFSFVGRQVALKVDGTDYFLDLLFYHIKLKCYVVVELKTTDFKAEFAGKMNFYLSAVDDLMKNENDNPTIGILLCQSKSKIVAEYALRGLSQPIGIAEYELSKSVPKELKSNLPTIEQIEEELKTNTEE
jgi:predicted nuclease of restriction endonuclease-like (RecB) superfamily